MRNKLVIFFTTLSVVIIIELLYLNIYYTADDSSSESLRGSKDDLLRTDKEFSDKSVKDGVAAAFISYADNNVILMRNKQFPIMGSEELKEHYSKIKDDGSKLEWEPVKAEVAGSGELGYTFGNWIYTAKNDKGSIDTSYGNYVTIWKKQKDGDWKFVLDGGNATPDPRTQIKK
jgi:ketosteroid isomerase-like protein